MLNKKESLERKVLEAGAHYVAQQVEVNIDELKEHEFTDCEISILEEKGLKYIESLIADNYNAFDDMTNEEVEAIKMGLSEYGAYGLVNDWSVGICDYDYDEIIGDYLIKIKDMSWNEKYGRLYATVMSVRDN